MSSDELTVNALTRGCVYNHTCQRGCTRFEQFEYTHRGKDTRAFGAHVFGTRLGARKAGTIHEQHVEPRLRAEPRRRRARRAAAYDKDLR